MSEIFDLELTIFEEIFYPFRNTVGKLEGGFGPLNTQLYPLVYLILKIEENGVNN